MGELSAMLRDGAAGNAARKPSRHAHPKGFEPGVLIDGDTATVTSEAVPAGEAFDIGHLFAYWQLNPDEWRIVGNVNVRAWDSNLGGGEVKIFNYYKADLERVDPADALLFEQLVDEIRKRRPVKRPVEVDGSTFCVVLGDFQAGKGEGGGTSALFERFMSCIDGALDQFRMLKRAGVVFERVALLGVGDLVEGCHGFYSTQAFQIDLNRRDQVRLVARLIDYAVDAFLPLSEITVAAVPGNHGENREGGKLLTDNRDNDDMLVFDIVQHGHSKNPDRYGHVRWVYPEGQDLWCTVDLSGSIVALAHGHQGGKGQNPEAKLVDWWKNASFGNTPMQDADLLVTGHYHHFRQCEVRGTRNWLQAPALDGGSQWFADRMGQGAQSALLTFTTRGGVTDHVRLIKPVESLLLSA